jgi:hypothetical protein
MVWFAKPASAISSIDLVEEMLGTYKIPALPAALARDNSAYLLASPAFAAGAMKNGRVKL